MVFENDKGEIVRLKDDGTSAFVKRKGVYFIRLSVPRNNEGYIAKSGFTRPGAA